MNRTLNIESVEGEIALIIEYVPGESEAISVLQGAMQLIEALDGLDHCLLSSINTSLEPVSILNDIQHSSLKILLARALRKIPDELVTNLDWKKWVGGLLVKGKYKLLAHIDADAPVINQVLVELEPEYKAAPALVGYLLTFKMRLAMLAAPAPHLAIAP
jgi:GAF domain-containing protein